MPWDWTKSSKRVSAVYLSLLTVPDGILVVLDKACLCISSSMRQSRRISETRKTKCSGSMTTLLKGMVAKIGAFCTFHFRFDLGNFDNSIFSSMVRETSLVGSSKGHCAVVSIRSSAGHLHQMHAYLLVADWIPVAIARNFQSPPRKNSTYSILEAYCIESVIL